MPAATSEPAPIESFTVDLLRVVVHRDRAALGRAAAAEVAREIAARQSEVGRASVVFAAAPSQNEFLDALVGDHDIDWARLIPLHMDEYAGIGPDHPASFRRYLRTRLFERVAIPTAAIRLIPGENVKRPLVVCLTYEAILRAAPPDVVCGGIGENGHLAFNDPPVADFLDPVWVKPVRLDAACRRQQVNDGCFDSIAEVPTHAYTLTIPALMAARRLSLCVPGGRKAAAVRAALLGPIEEACPASVVRRHPGAVLHLDVEAAAQLG